MTGADVGIVGAGFAGLAAALMLRRHRRSIFVFDGGPPRNERAAEVHGYLGAEGVSGAELRRRGCDQVASVGGAIIQARIESAAREGDRFRLGSGDRSWLVDRVLLATGVKDIYPDIDRFFDFYGKSVFTCPHCDAYEIRGRPVAVVSWGPQTLGFTQVLGQWTDRITVVTDGRSAEVSPDERRELEERGIPLITQTVGAFEGKGGDLRALRFEDGSELPVSAAFFTIGHRWQTELAEMLGCAVSDEGCIRTDDHLRTNVQGVWAAGDIVGQEHLVAVATGQGVRAAVDIDRSLASAERSPSPTGTEQPNSFPPSGNGQTSPPSPAGRGRG